MSKKPTPEAIEQALKDHGNNKTAAAEALGCNRWVVWKFCKEQGVENETAVHRKLRKAESDLKRKSDELDVERKRRAVAEHDLEEVLERDMLVQELEDEGISPRVLKTLKPNITEGGCTAIICANDWHLEKNVVPSTVSGLNEFNLDIAAARIDRFWQKSIYMIDLWRNIANVDEIILWLGGDLINNYLHDEDVESNFCGPTEAILCVEEHVATGIDSVKPDRIVTNYGNHGRTTRFNRPATGWKTSWEYLAYKHLERQYPKIDWQITQGYLNYQQVQGHTVRFHHGEHVKYYGGVGGLTIPMNKATQQWDKSINADLTIGGHFHQYLDYWSWLQSGCLCGYDAYAQSIKAEYQEPTQTVAFVDSKRGKVQSLPIFVDRPRRSL